MARTTSTRPQRSKRTVIFEGNTQKRWRKLKSRDNRSTETHTPHKSCQCSGKCPTNCHHFMRIALKRGGCADDWDTTDHATETLRDILDEEWEREEEELREFEKDLEEQRERAAANRRRRELEAAEELLRDASRPSKGAFSSKNRNNSKENDMTDELSPVREHELSSHVGWPSPAHKPRKPLPTDPENPYRKPRFKGNVPAQFRSSGPVGMGYVRSGKVTKVG